MLHLRLNIDAISSASVQSSSEQKASQEKVMNSLAGVDERISRVEEMLRTQAEQVQSNQMSQIGPLYTTAQTYRNRAIPSKGLTGTLTPRVEGMGIRVSPYTVACRSGCTCECHLQQKSKSPAFLNRFLGQLFVGYAGLPVLSSKCNLASCQKPQSSNLSLEYWFPFGFLSSTIVRLQAGHQPNMGTLFQLDTLRRVPDTAQCVTMAQTGDIEGLKYLFSRGLASPRDVSSTRGYSLLRWALYAKQYDTFKFLVYSGADPDYRPIAASDNSPRKKACHFLLEGNLSDDASDALQTLTNGSYFGDFIDEAEYTQIHRIVLDLSMKSLDEELELHPRNVNVPDTMGRTPLAWAAARGDTRTVVTLLSHGANPNATDVQMSGPLSNAAAQGHTVCVRLLLEAGADPDPAILRVEKKGSPLNCAARNGTEVLLLKTLLDFGADIESSGVDGKTPLIHAARTNNASFALLLLEYGADLNAISTSGATPLTTAITCNSHDVLQLILDRWHEYSTCPRLKGPHLLQIVATYADIKTINTLAATDHLRSMYDKQYTLGDFGSRLRQRPDLTEKLTLAFDELLSIINSNPDPREDPENLMEAGYFSCLPSRANTGIGDIDMVGKATTGEGCLSAVTSALSSYKHKCETGYTSDADSDESFVDALEAVYLGATTYEHSEKSWDD